MSEKVLDVTEMVFHRYLANHQILALETDETYRVTTAIQQVAERLKKERNQTAFVYLHDKFCGFYDGTPSMEIPTDKTNSGPVAIQLMVLDETKIKQTNPQVKQMPFDPKHNIIFILKDWDAEMSNNLMTIQGMRNVVQSNMGSDQFFYNEDSEASTRGKRLFVFLFPTGRCPTGIPELKPHVVPLPDDKVIGEAVDAVLQPLIDANKQDKKTGVPKPSPEVRFNIITSLRGSPYQFAEDTTSFALAKHRGLGDMKAVLETIENERSTYIAGIPGLIHIPKKNLTPVSQLAGYEPAVEFIRDCMSIDDEAASKHKVQKLRGITVAGAPGGGKTQFGMAVAQETNRLLLLWSLGESQGSLVGDSEANTRRAIQIAQATGAVVLLDDVDKAGVSVASGASKASVEGGPFGRMVQMLLTEMSSDDNRAIWVFTANRTKNLPPELIRPGRMDERFFVERPDQPTRESIISIHCLKRQFEVDTKMAGVLSDDAVTDGWTGAELEDLIKRGVRRALRLGEKKLDFKWMMNTAKGITPMIKQEAYKDDIEEMERFCETWTKVGRTSLTSVDEQRVTSGRAKRSTSI